MDFRSLQMRLLSHVQARVHNGELSERSLARLTGISQPHIHNVLKGKRALSAEMADRIMGRMRIDISDLVVPRQEGLTQPADCGDCRAVPLLEGWIGREHPYPRSPGPERYPFRAEDVSGLGSPAAARLAPDPLRPPIFGSRGVVLLDRSEKVRLGMDEESYFALDLVEAGTIGMVRKAGMHLYLWVRHADEWHSTRLPDREPLEIIQGRVRLVVRQV